MTFRGQFKNGVVVFDEPPPLPDGAAVDVAPVGHDTPQPTDAESFQEHEVVRLRNDIEVEGHRLRRGMVGAIVSIYQGGEAFAVEFDDLSDGPDVVTLRPADIEKSGTTDG